MEWAQWLFLESLAALGTLLFLVNYALLVYWRRRGRGRPLLIALALTPLLLFAQDWIATPRERAVAVLRSIEHELPLAQVAALEAALAQDFAADPMDRTDFVAYARRGLESVRIVQLSKPQLKIEESSADSFVVRAAYTVVVELADIPSRPFRSTWRITFVRRGERWLIGRIELPVVAGTQIQNWAQLQSGR